LERRKGKKEKEKKEDLHCNAIGKNESPISSSIGNPRLIPTPTLPFSFYASHPKIKQTNNNNNNY